jgi:hypothetical protein
LWVVVRANRCASSGLSSSLHPFGISVPVQASTCGSWLYSSHSVPVNSASSRKALHFLHIRPRISSEGTYHHPGVSNLGLYSGYHSCGMSRTSLLWVPFRGMNRALAAGCYQISAIRFPFFLPPEDSSPVECSLVVHK